MLSQEVNDFDHLEFVANTDTKGYIIMKLEIIIEI